MKSHYDTHGDCLAENMEARGDAYLAKWCHNQRTRFSQGKLSEREIEKLTELEFEFTPQVRVLKEAKIWEEHFVSSFF